MPPQNTKPSCPIIRQDSGHRGDSSQYRGSVFECDILIIGAGAAGLAAAAAVQDQGRRVILVEKEDYVGGTTFRSGGCMWMPNNFRMQELGIEDSKEQAERYIAAVGKATSPGLDEDIVLRDLQNRRLKAFLTQGPEMAKYFRNQGFRWMAAPSKFPDYHPHMEGAVAYGRTLDPEVFDAASLEGWVRYLQVQENVPVISRFEDLCVLTRRPFSTGCATKTVAPPQDMERPMSMGQSLIAQLLKICKEHSNVTIWTRCELQELLVSDLDGRVIGAKVLCGRSEKPVHIHASLGVVLTTGGFSQNQKMRDTYLGIGSTDGRASKISTMAGWSLAAPGDIGIALQVSQRLHADSAQLDQVWGIPTMINPGTGKVTEAMFAISKPFSFVVDGYGRRFFSESQPYGAAVRSMYERAKKGSRTAEFWLIFDDKYMQAYPIGGLQSPWLIDQAVEKGLLVRSDTVDGLSKQILVPNQSLQATLSEWNEMCDGGRDKHFHRGEDRYQQFIGDPDVTPNPCMGPVKESPFYAIKIFPGDAGTRGGPLTDEFARVLRKNGDVIDGLFAGGNASAALLESQGAGTTLAPAMTEGFIAVTYMLSLASAASSS
ncbi:3-ketosteroid 1-dehydrogenase helE [Fusarium oxysporum f. sp. cubense]|uniref:3-oxosteroid 1-dehydrogenase n=2 Tax=Fusarium oxysporum f. sp. cubense TaxID=61366 RepID=N4U9W0_FUSC1|nr:3-oxosteroid 1-dehydrogenase [Fusarium oxysporum f. sp. cubense race 1]TVY74816.1 3-ketosteroid 1-dehydrogenase helE [Fusarium oxysporum f. sp. cubense]TXB98057.1 hypothetical protein FocTR4_00017065 [Fusarium oxysporum f. sp. cubense]